MKQAARIAINRTVAGVHFPIDSAAGTVLGLTLGNYFVSRCKAGTDYQPWIFNGKEYKGNPDFDWNDFFSEGKQIAGPGASKEGAPVSPVVSSSVNWLWEKAVEEWQVEAVPDPA